MANADITPFKPITKEAEDILNQIIRQKELALLLNTQLFCVVLGPAEHSHLHALRIKCRDHIRALKHHAFFPEELTEEDINRRLIELHIDEHRREAFTSDRSSLNNFLITSSDLIFILAAGQGALIEFGKYIGPVPHKIKSFVAEKEYHPESLLSHEAKSVASLNPDCVLTYKEESEIFAQIKKCLVLELRKKLRSVSNG